MQSTLKARRAGRLPVLFTLILTSAALPGCAQTSLLDGLKSGLDNSQMAENKDVKPKKTDKPAELATATAYWGQQYARQPADPKIALNFARNLKAMGQTERALAVLSRTEKLAPGNRQLTSELGRLAAETGHDKMAEAALTRTSNASDWKAISAKGALAARKGEYKTAQQLFERALAIKPGKPSLVNNLALAYALDGQADKGESLLRQVIGRGDASPKVRQNLALILGLQGKFDQARDVTSRDLPVTLASANEDYMRKMLNLPKSGNTGGSQSAPAVKSSNDHQIAASHFGTWQTDVKEKKDDKVKTADSTEVIQAPLPLMPGGQ